MATKTKIALVVTIVAVFAFGALSAFAQSDTNPTPTPAAPGYGWYGMMGRGGFGGHDMMGFGIMWDDDASPMFDTVATTLGINEQILIADLQSGKTIAQIAEENGVDLATLTTDLQKEMTDHLQALVDAGVLTQAQADARLSLMQDHWDDMPMFAGQGFGMMYSGMWSGQQHHGMMGWSFNN